MRTNIKPENRRLLEALEYIDEDIVLGVLAGLKNPIEKEVHGEYKKPSPFKHWRQFTALAACLLLLSAAFPVLNYAVQRFGTGIWEGIAGAGTSELETPTPTENEFLETEPEMTQTLETESAITEAEIIDSGFDKHLEAFADMSADEIYAEVLKGGWVVIGDGNSDFAVGGELWYDFFEKTQKGESTYVLIADYIPNYSRDDIKEPVIFLTEIVYNGDLFYHKCIFSLTNEIDSQGEYKYLRYSDNSQEFTEPFAFLSNQEDISWSDLRDHYFNAVYVPELELFNDFNYLIFHLHG